MAGEWVQGVDENYPNSWSYKEDGGKWMQHDYASSVDNSLVYYISPNGTMITNNYAPNGGVTTIYIFSEDLIYS